MREIKFRGKRLDNGEWIYGDLQIGDDDHIPMIGTVGPGRWVEYIQVEKIQSGSLPNSKTRTEMIFGREIYSKKTVAELCDPSSEFPAVSLLRIIPYRSAMTIGRRYIRILLLPKHKAYHGWLNVAK